MLVRKNSYAVKKKKKKERTQVLLCSSVREESHAANCRGGMLLLIAQLQIKSKILDITITDH